MKILFLSLIVTSSILSASSTNIYEGCGSNRDEALQTLSGNIKTRVDSNFVQNIQTTNNDSVQSKISTYLSTSSKLTLTNITIRNDKKQVCASVKHEDQAQNTQKALAKALKFKKENLPKNIDEKIKKLDLWIKDIKELSFLVPTFLDNKDKEQVILNKKEKVFQDLYDESIEMSNSLVWRTCEDTKDDAKESLNKLLFVDKGVKEEQGFWTSLTSVFTPSKNPDIDYFKDNITYTDKKDKKCAMIKKDELLLVAIKMNNEAKRFNYKSFDKDPKKRYAQNKLYVKQFALTKKLISLYPKTFKSGDFSNIVRVRDLVIANQKITHPQFVKFNVISKKDVVIKLDNDIIENKKEVYIKVGEHSYTIDSDERCQISGTFDIDLLEDEGISKDFIDYMYPSVNFISSIEGTKPIITIDSKNYNVNQQIFMDKCSDDDINYMATYAGQKRMGEISLQAGEKNTIELKFLTSKELAIFNNVTTLNFETTSGVKFSETLTSQTSKNLKYSVGLGDGVSNGDLNIHEKGSFTYQSDKDFVGIDSFTYIVSANGEESGQKIVNITVYKSNAPVAVIIPKENNETKKEEKKEEKTEEKKEEVKKEKINEEMTEEKYEKFEEYLNKLGESGDTEKINSMRTKYPESFNKFIKSKSL